MLHTGTHVSVDDNPFVMFSGAFVLMFLCSHLRINRLAHSKSFQYELCLLARRTFLCLFMPLLFPTSPNPESFPLEVRVGSGYPL